MVLVSLEYVEYGQAMACMPKIEHKFLAITPIFKYRCRSFIFISWAIFGEEMGVATTRDPHGLGPTNPTKKLAHRVDLLGQPLSRNHVFEIFRGEPPS